MEQDALTAAMAIIENFGKHRSAEYFAGFAEDATFIFHSTPDFLESRVAYESLWRQWELERGFKVARCIPTNRDIQLRGDVAIFSHDVETRVEIDGNTETLLERETMVLENQPTGWICIHEHLSAMP